MTQIFRELVNKVFKKTSFSQNVSYNLSYFSIYRFDDIFNLMKKSGLSTTDVIGLEALLIINGITSVIAIKHLRKKCKHLTDLNERLVDMNHHFGIGDKQMRKVASGIIRSILQQSLMGY